MDKIKGSARNSVQFPVKKVTSAETCDNKDKGNSLNILNDTRYNISYQKFKQKVHSKMKYQCFKSQSINKVNVFKQGRTLYLVSIYIF